MRIRAETKGAALGPALADRLHAQRAARAFNPIETIQAKAARINAYLRQAGLSACVFGVSGGIDSAVVAGLVAAARAEPDSPIRRIVGLLLPAIGTDGVSGQDAARTRGRLACAAFGIEAAEADLGPAFVAAAHPIEASMDIAASAWAQGQMVPILRTAALYYATTLLTQEGLKALVLGTTNLDEGGWLGYFGKASDAMVDLQLISDLHKSEVRSTAVALGVPQAILDAEPTGDMFDGRVDEEVFGAGYDFVELYAGWLRQAASDPKTAWTWRHGLDAKDAGAFDTMAAALDALHAHNAHKYTVGSPAIHLDLYEASVPGGWHNSPWQPGRA